MKKTINLTDGELAIGMWIYVYNYIAGADISYPQVSVTSLKLKYLEKHGKGRHYWYNVCLLCQRYCNEGGKCECPLSENGLDCGIGSSWLKVCDYFYSEKHRQEALEVCEKIINIMIVETRGE